MVGPLNRKFQPSGATRRTALGLILGAPPAGGLFQRAAES